MLARTMGYLTVLLSQDCIVRRFPTKLPFVTDFDDNAKPIESMGLALWSKSIITA
jgi:hypothetical protein